MVNWIQKFHKCAYRQCYCRKCAGTYTVSPSLHATFDISTFYSNTSHCKANKSRFKRSDYCFKREQVGMQLKFHKNKVIVYTGESKIEKNYVFGQIYCILLLQSLMKPTIILAYF